MKGVIIVSFLEQYQVEILGLSVETTARRQGIGTFMIGKLVDEYSFTLVLAETDQNAVDFYRKNGFQIVEYLEDYNGQTVVRYRCKLQK